MVRLAAPGSWSRLLPCTTNAAGSALRRKIGPDAADPERATAIAGCAPGLQPRRAKLPNTSGELLSLFIREGRQAGVEKARANEEPIARTVLDDDPVHGRAPVDDRRGRAAEWAGFGRGAQPAPFRSRASGVIQKTRGILVGDLRAVNLLDGRQLGRSGKARNMEDLAVLETNGRARSDGLRSGLRTAGSGRARLPSDVAPADMAGGSTAGSWPPVLRSGGPCTAWRRRFAAAALGVLLLATPAWPHASLVKSSPGRAPRSRSRPTASSSGSAGHRVTFSASPCGTRPAAGRLRGRAGRARGPKRLTVGVKPLGRGAYRVRFRVLSVDGHVVESEFPFTLRP